MGTSYVLHSPKNFCYIYIRNTEPTSHEGSLGGLNDLPPISYDGVFGRAAYVARVRSVLQEGTLGLGLRASCFITWIQVPILVYGIIEEFGL